MHIHIHRLGGHLQEQHEHRVAAVEHDIAVCAANGMRNEAVAYVATVDVEILLVCLTTRMRGQANPTPQAQTVALLIQVQRMFGECVAE